MPRIHFFLLANCVLSVVALSTSVAEHLDAELIPPVRIASFGTQAATDDESLETLKTDVADEEPSEREEDELNELEQDEATANGQIELTDRNQRRIAELRKPLRSVRIVVSTQETVPTSIADELLSQSDAITISSSAETIARPDRYTIGFCHRPLYFEELNLERCGKTYGCATNAVSGFHFLTNTAMLPYRLATQRADCTIATHGDCQTCSQYSHDIEPFGCEPRGVLVEAAAAAGFIFLML